MYKQLKRIYAFVFMGLISQSILAQIVNSKDAAKLKKTKLIYGLIEYPKKAEKLDKEKIDSANAAFLYALERHWTFNTIEQVLPRSEAKRNVKMEDGYAYIALDDIYSIGFLDGTDRDRDYSEGQSLSIFGNGKIASTLIPFYGFEINRAKATYTVLQLNWVLEALYSGEVKSTIGMMRYISKNNNKIIQKKLLLPKEYLHDKVSDKDFTAKCKEHIKLVSLEEMEEVVLSRDSDYAYVYDVPTPIDGRIVHYLYISNAEDGQIFDRFASSGWQVINTKEIRSMCKLYSQD